MYEGIKESTRFNKFFKYITICGPMLNRLNFSLLLSLNSNVFFYSNIALRACVVTRLYFLLRNIEFQNFVALFYVKAD